jgi:hypothetical protein
MKNLILLLLMLSIQVAAFAQNTGKITGKVTDRISGEPLVGATVTLRGSNSSTITDNNGAFTLSNLK